MIWRKLGQIYKFKPIDNYLLSHASNPLAVRLNDDIYRVFFSGRDKENRSSIGYVDIDIVKQIVIDTCKNVIFKYGEEESFYSHGVSIGNLYEVENKKYIQFMAWQIRNGDHWRGDIGRLSVNDDLKSMKLNPKDIYLKCDKEDQVSLSYPWIMFDENIYKMWYGSTLNWSSENSEMVHVIKYATSEDGHNWKKHGLAIPYEIGVAQAFSRPTVLKNENGYHMWFSYRSGDGTKYRIGYANSLDGGKWNRKEDSGITVGLKDEWDANMVCYPFVFTHKGQTYMLYNGNEYGKHGFGLALLEEK